MIYELRTYTFHPGKLNAYLDLARNVGRPVRGQDYGTNHGYWVAEFGALNQVWHMWSYKSLDERARLRDELAKNERWTNEYVPGVRPLMVRQDIRFLQPVYGVNPPAEPGGIYELRMYRTQPGMAVAWAKAYKEIMPVREKYSKNVGIWSGEAPQPNEVFHMWNYPNCESRMKSRTELFKDPDWLAFVAKNSHMLAEMHNVMLIPTDFSPMK